MFQHKKNVVHGYSRNAFATRQSLKPFSCEYLYKLNPLYSNAVFEYRGFVFGR